MKTIELTQNKVAIVDDNDYEELSKHKWFAYKNSKYSHTFYAGRNHRLPNGKRITIRLHSGIMQTPKGMVTDHKDGNGLNNQRDNLRVCTQSENMMNRGKKKDNLSGFKGVCWHKQKQKWYAQISVNSKKIFIGLFYTKELAYEAYKVACNKYHRDFANF